MDQKEYYKLNKYKYQKGGIYYKYKPNVSEGKLIIKKGKFFICFD